MSIAFTPEDHVTEREPGDWEDCTFASVLETLRLALPGGRNIPPTITEVNRFRAKTGLPDNHTGATIGQVIPAAKQLYGLNDSQYTLTRDWAVAENAMRNPSCVFAITGKTSALPPSIRITSFMGAHCTAGRGHPVTPTMCDPLGAKDGRYEGVPVALSTWRAFAFALGYWQMFFMEVQGGSDEMIAAGGIKITSDKLARATTAAPVLDAPSGKKILTLSPGQKVPYLGNSSAHRAVLVHTGIPYPDKVTRPTILYVANNLVAIEDAPPVPSGGTDTGPSVEAKWEAWVATHP